MMYLATFHTHFGALSLERKLKKQGIREQMMPVPRSLSASCGVCVRFAADSPAPAQNAEDLEALYAEENGAYTLVFQGE